MEINGRITKDALLVKVGKDKQVINFCIAINDSYKPKGASEIKEVVTYINCDYWLGAGVLPYLKKGCLVSLFGRIGLSVYLNHDGNPLGSLTFHVNHLKILAFARKNAVATTSVNPSQDSTDKEPDDLPF